MSTIKSSNEHLTLNADGSGKDIKFQSNGSEVAQITDGGVVSSTGGSTHADNVKARFGTGNDFAIWHDGSHTRFQNDTGNLNVRANVFNVTKSDDSENIILAEADGDVKLYRNNVIHLETLATGVRVPVGGVLFGTDTAANNALDDYEEGNWTPTWSPTGGSWSGTGVGKYTKIGRQVTASFNWVASGQATGTKFNAVGGLPFTSLNETTTYVASVSMNGGGASGNSLTATLSPNQTEIYLQMQPDSTSTHGEFLPSQTASNCTFNLTITYMTA